MDPIGNEGQHTFAGRPGDITAAPKNSRFSKKHGFHSTPPSKYQANMGCVYPPIAVT